MKLDDYGRAARERAAAHMEATRTATELVPASNPWAGETAEYPAVGSWWDGSGDAGDDTTVRCSDCYQPTRRTDGYCGSCIGARRFVVELARERFGADPMPKWCHYPEGWEADVGGATIHLSLWSWLEHGEDADVHGLYRATAPDPEPDPLALAREMVPGVDWRGSAPGNARILSGVAPGNFSNRRRVSIWRAAEDDVEIEGAYAWHMWGASLVGDGGWTDSIREALAEIARRVER